MGSNIIYSDTKTRLALSVTGPGLSYNNATGLFTSTASVALVFSNITSFGASVGSGAPAAQFAAGSSFVELRGVVSISGAKAVASTLFTLPVGSRPGATRYSSANSVNSGNLMQNTLLNINTDGTVNIFNGTLANGDTVYLDNVRFSLGT